MLWCPFYLGSPHQKSWIRPSFDDSHQFLFVLSMQTILSLVVHLIDSKGMALFAETVYPV